MPTKMAKFGSKKPSVELPYKARVPMRQAMFQQKPQTVIKLGANHDGSKLTI